MATQLIRAALSQHYRDADDAHPGLLIQRGYERDDRETEEGRQAKTAHIRRICAIPAGTFYQSAYQRWRETTGNELRFKQLELALYQRLFIGLTAGGMLETGCAISHSYGMPYIPGSSVKGVVRAHVRQSPFGKEHPEVIDELFGAAADPEQGHAEGLSGLVVFHDAWWVPTNQEVSTPFAEEIVTSHHLDYYGREGAVEASDSDSPVPNAQIAVRGSFLFVLEGEPAWRDLAAQMLTAALSERGIGAKTRTGYGLFDPEPKAPAGPVCGWVDDTIASLVPKPHNNEQEALLGKSLATEWSKLDGDLKAAALADIRARWDALGQWASPGKGAKKAKKIYTGEGDA
jgi:CRISPR-associated protein Cmr6